MRQFKHNKPAAVKNLRKEQNVNSELKPDISRRGFLKLSATTMAVAAVGSTLFSSKKSLVPLDAAKKDNGSVWKKSYCSSCIWPNCTTEIEVKDGVAVRLVGNPDGPFNKGTLCPRGSAQLANLYNPYRVKAPMKRTNPEKGLDVDPGWVEITWDEAFTTIADKLKAVRASDPRKFAVKLGSALRSTKAEIR